MDLLKPRVRGLVREVVGLLLAAIGVMLTVAVLTQSDDPLVWVAVLASHLLWVGVALMLRRSDESEAPDLREPGP